MNLHFILERQTATLNWEYEPCVWVTKPRATTQKTSGLIMGPEQGTRPKPCTYMFIISVITFMRAIHNYIPVTNYVSRAYSVAAVLYLQFVLQVMLFLT